LAVHGFEQLSVEPPKLQLDIEIVPREVALSWRRRTDVQMAVAFQVSLRARFSAARPACRTSAADGGSISSVASAEGALRQHAPHEGPQSSSGRKCSGGKAKHRGYSRNAGRKREGGHAPAALSCDSNGDERG